MTYRLKSSESLAIALKRFRERLGKPKRLRPLTEPMRLKRGTTSSINITNVAVAEKEENEKYSNLPPQEGWTHLVRFKAMGPQTGSNG
ncbi:hypothetical protein CHS0354_011942 [Potamilus streckersoni]|uniref:Uncharacterized protein n=1 Tax=Potamilus streckersoni TaxID=2493646 RepID=A0AAE0T0V8_9BIVA|nr:hypothetical protein CHS0354_011942 [Potamilus streckersoni]